MSDKDTKQAWRMASINADAHQWMHFLRIMDPAAFVHHASLLYISSKTQTQIHLHAQRAL
jgi:hypothetical protein